MRLVIVSLFLLLVPSFAAGQSVDAIPSNIRVTDRDLQRLLTSGSRSAHFRSLVDRIDETNLVVYVRCALFRAAELEGRLTFLSASPLQRFAVIEIACYIRPRSAQVGILAHELQHAVEVAGAPDVVDTASFDRFYARRGELVRQDCGTRAYETAAAVESAKRVRSELRGLE